MTKPQQLYAVMPAADGCPGVVTHHKAIFQGSLTGGAEAAELWLRTAQPQSLPRYFLSWLQRMPGSAYPAFQDGFLLRLEQRLLAQRTLLDEEPNDE